MTDLLPRPQHVVARLTCTPRLWYRIGVERGVVCQVVAL